jgi:hypothetical protein
MSPRSDILAGLPPPRPVSLRRKLLVLVASFVGLAVVGWVDYLTGYELGIFVIYSVPVGMTAWYAGRWPALATALGASITWWLADRFNGVNFSSRFYIYWNLTIHFFAFVINAVTIAKIKRELDDRHALEAELRRVHRLLNERAEGVCPVCQNATAGGVATTPNASA